MDRRAARWARSAPRLIALAIGRHAARMIEVLAKGGGSSNPVVGIVVLVLSAVACVAALLVVSHYKKNGKL